MSEHLKNNMKINLKLILLSTLIVLTYLFFHYTKFYMGLCPTSSNITEVINGNSGAENCSRLGYLVYVIKTNPITIPLKFVTQTLILGLVLHFLISLKNKNVTETKSQNP
jgi:hypothetical protein